jgi:hypothetical protein
MLTEIFKNRTLIWEGLKNKLFRDEHVEAVYLDRRAICDGCDHKDIEGSKCAVPGTKPCCSLCGCSLSLKLRSLASECPAKKWEAVVTQQEEEMIRQQILNNRLNGTES